MNKEFIEQLIKEVKENYEPSEIGELTVIIKDGNKKYEKRV